MSVLAEFDSIRAALAAPGQPFEMIERPIKGVPMQVYKALLNDVTEVAAKQLHTSSESQIALFKREIAIHKRCRSVSSPPPPPLQTRTPANSCQRRPRADPSHDCHAKVMLGRQQDTSPDLSE